MTRGYCLDSLRQLTLLKPDATITNYEFVQCLKQMRLWKDTNHIVPTAFNLYDKINEKKNHYSIRTLLKLCSSSTVRVSPCQIKMIWEDILHTNNVQNISQTAIVKCVSNTMKHRQSTKDIEMCIHILQSLLANHEHSTSNRTIYCALIHAYGLCSDIDNAHDAFRSLSIGIQMDSISVSAMMTALIKNQKYKNALALYEEYRALQDDVMHLLAIKACIKTSDFKYGKEVIATNIGNDEAHSVKLYSALIDLYGACHDVDAAEAIYRCIPSDERDIVSMCSMMTCYLKNNANDECLRIYAAQSNDRSKNNVSHLLALKACINTRNTSLGKHIILNSKHMSIEMLITMIRFYLNSDDIQSALHTFHSIPRQYMNATQIELMMKSCVRRGYGQEALSIYKHFDALNKNDVIHLLAIKTCLQLEAFGVGQDIIDSLHVGSIRKIELLNSIIAFYGKIGDMEKACTVFDLIKKKSTVTINAMMNAYCDNEMHTECVELAMKNIKPDHITFAIAFKSCIHQNALCFGEKMHRYLQQNDSNILASSDVQINLICLYGKNGKLSECEQIFEAIRDKDAMAWHAMMHAFGRNGETERLLQLFDEMCNHKRLSPTDKTYCIVLNACSKDHNGVQTHVLNHLSDTQCINIESLQLQLHEMSVKELYHLLDRFIFCFRILQQHEFVFNDNFCNLPALQVDDSIATDDTLSLQRVFKTVHTIPSAEHRRIIQQLIDALQLSMIESLGNKEWLKILDGFGLMHNIDQMMDAYHQMMSSSSSIQRIGSNVLTVLLHHLIRSGETQHAANIWQDIRNDKDTKRFTLNSLVLQSLMLCVNRTRYLYHDEIVHEMWDVMVNERRVKPTLHCSTVALLLSSKYQSKKMYHKILSTLDTSLLTSNHQCFIQILTSCGSSSDMQNMWSFYNKYATVNGHDVMGLTVLASYETREHHMRNILNLVSDLKRAALSTDQLIAFHRVALQCGHKEVQQNMRSVLQEHKIKTNVFAQYRLGDECYFISNGYDSHCAPKLDQLLKEIHYKPNTSVCKQFGQLLSDSATVKHLKHHAEKKALAILIKNNITSIKIKVTMKMCIDCHDFFAKISKKYKDYRIECVDPTGIHLFQNGSCYLCDNLKIGACVVDIVHDI
eukprot:437849_1